MSEHLWQILSDSFLKILIPGLLTTIPLTAISFVLALILGSLVALVQFANITVTEMFMATQRIVARTYEPLALYIEVALIYLAFSTVLTKLQRIAERKINFFTEKSGGQR